MLWGLVHRTSGGVLVWFGFVVSTLLVFYMLLRGESPRFFGLHVGFSIIQTSCRSLGPRARM